MERRNQIEAFWVGHASGPYVESSRFPMYVKYSKSMHLDQPFDFIRECRRNKKLPVYHFHLMGIGAQHAGFCVIPAEDLKLLLNHVFSANIRYEYKVVYDGA